MSKFGADRTNIGEIDNAVTPKQAPRRDEYAAFLGAAAQAAKGAVEGYTAYKAGEFRKEEEKTYRQILDIEKGPNPEEVTSTSLKEFEGNVGKYNQLVQQGRAMRAEALLEEDLRRRVAKEPFLADAYRKVADQLSSDYTAIRTSITDMERQAAANAAAKTKRLEKLLTEVHMAPIVPMPDGSWQIMNIDDLSDDQIKFLERAAYAERGRIGSQDELFKIAGESRQERGEERAEIGLGLSINADKRAAAKEARSSSDWYRARAVDDYVVATSVALSREFNDNALQIMRGPGSNEEKATKIKGLLTAYKQNTPISMRTTQDGRTVPVPDTAVQTVMTTFDRVAQGYEDILIGKNSPSDSLRRIIDYNTRMGIVSFGPDGVQLLALQQLLGPGMGALAFDGAFRTIMEQTANLGRGIGKTLETQRVETLEQQNQAYSQGILSVKPEYRDGIIRGNAKVFAQAHRPGTEAYETMPKNDPKGYTKVLGMTAETYSILDPNDKKIINTQLENGEIIRQVNKLPAEQKTQAADYAFNLYKENLQQFMKSNRTQGNGFEYDEGTNTLIPDNPADQGLADKYNQYLEYLYQMDQMGSNPSPNKKTLITTQLWPAQ